jgi:hypothetical protein
VPEARNTTGRITMILLWGYGCQRSSEEDRLQEVGLNNVERIGLTLAELGGQIPATSGRRSELRITILNSVPAVRLACSSRVIMLSGLMTGSPSDQEVGDVRSGAMPAQPP